MADGVVLNTMSGGKTVASDEIAGQDYQRVKLIHGADGVNAGDVSSVNGLPTQVVAALPAGDNNIGNVDIVSSALPTGAATSAKQDVDAALLSTIAGAVTNPLTVVGAVDVLSLPALPAGTNNIGDVDVLTLPALPAGDNNIGNVDIVTLPALPAGTNNIGDVDIVSSVLPTGAATEAKQDSAIALLTTIDADTSVLVSSQQVHDAVYATGQPLQMAGGVRRDADTTPISNDGDVHPLTFDESGRLKVSTYPASLSAVTGNITANGQTVSIDTTRYSNLTIYCTGTFSTVNCTFEGSIDGGTTWFAVQAVRTNANTVELTTGNLSAAPVYGWKLSVNALTHFRVRATAWTSGTQVWRFSPGVYATEPIPAIQTHAVTGSGTFTISGAVTMAANATTTPAKAQDGAAGATDTGIPALFVRRDNPTALTPVAGDYAFGQISSTGELYVAPGARTTGGLTIFRSIDVDETKAQVKGSAGSLVYLEACNLTAATLFLQVYDALSASVTVGTTTPTMTFVLPSNGTAQCRELEFGLPGAAFATGITLAVTTTFGGSAGPAANGCFVNALYK